MQELSNSVIDNNVHIITSTQCQGSQEQEVTFQDQFFSKVQDNFRRFLLVSRGSNTENARFFLCSQILIRNKPKVLITTESSYEVTKYRIKAMP